MAACGILVTCVGTGYAQGFVAGGGSPRAATAPKPFASTITVATSGKTAGAFTSHYLGLSFESTALNAGNFDTGGNLPQLLKNLGSSTMRFGGLSVDNNIQGYPQWMGVSRRGLAGLTRLVKASGWTVFYSEDLADFPFAAALWAINYSLLGAEYGMDGMNFHNMFFGTCAAYSEICPEASDPRQFTVRPIYYGLLFAHLLGTGKFLPVAVSTGATARNVVAYALKPASGGPHVMAENLTSLPTSITLAVGGSATSAKVLWLTAPGLLAKSGTRIQGATVSAATGVIKPGAPTVIRCSGGKCHLTLPAYTAAIVTLPLQAKCGGHRPAGDAKVLGRRSVAGEATSRETADQTQKKWPQKDSSYPAPRYRTGSG
jgi:hypothetical protein